MNLGVGGYGTLQELIMFPTVGVDHEPNFVLLGFYENDLQNNLRDLRDRLSGRPAPLPGESAGQ